MHAPFMADGGFIELACIYQRRILTAIPHACNKGDTYEPPGKGFRRSISEIARSCGKVVQQLLKRIRFNVFF